MINQVKIQGIGTFFPGEKITNDIIAKKFNFNEEWIDLFIGTKTRHFTIDLDSGKISHSLSDLCAKAAEKAIYNAGINARDIDALVLATATPEYLIPTSVNLVMEKLGINNKETYQIQSGCTGAIQALNIGYNLIASGSKSNVLVMGGDDCSKFFNVNVDYSKLESTELINYAIFGDGAGAVILSNKDNHNVSKRNMTIDNIFLRCVGQGIASAQKVNWETSYKKSSEKSLSEDYKAIEKMVPKLTNQTLNDLMAISDWDLDNIDYFLPPQLSKVMTNSIVKYLDLSRDINIVNCVEEVGNTANAMPFIQLDKLDNSNLLEKKAKVALISIESSKWIKSGMTLYV